MKWLLGPSVISKLLLLLLIGFLFNGRAHAADCATASLPKILSISSVKIPSNIAVGQVIPGSIQSFSISGSCTLGYANVGYINVGTKIVACVYTGNLEVLPGVYATSVAGIGVRMLDGSGNPLLAATGGGCQQGISTIQAGGAFNFTGTWELVRLSGTIPAGASLTQADGRWVFGVLGTGATLNGRGGGDVNTKSSLYPTGVISILNLTCTVNAPSIVTLSATPATALGAVGATAQPTPFTIGTTCNNSATVGLTLDAAPVYSVIDVNNGILSTKTGTGQAGGVALQVTDGNIGTPIRMQARTAEGTIAANTQTNYPFKISYIRTGAVTAGSVASAMVFTFDYQ